MTVPPQPYDAPAYNGSVSGEDFLGYITVTGIDGNGTNAGKWFDLRDEYYLEQVDNALIYGISETPFIRRGDSAYVIVEGPTWEEAEANENKLGGHLVTINDADENNFLYGFKEENELGKWIGLTDKNNEGQWEWSSGEVSSFNACDLNQPDDHVDPHNPNGQDFVSFDWDKGFEFNVLKKE